MLGDTAYLCCMLGEMLGLSVLCEEEESGTLLARERAGDPGWLVAVCDMALGGESQPIDQ